MKLKLEEMSTGSPQIRYTLMALKMHRYFKDDENLGAVRAYLDKCRDASGTVGLYHVLCWFEYQICP